MLELADDGVHAVLKHPSFLEIGSRLLAVGVPVDVILDEYERLRAETRAIAQRFTGVFRDSLWEPAVSVGLEADQARRLVGVLEELGPLAEAVVLASLRIALQDAAEKFADAEAERWESRCHDLVNTAPARPDRGHFGLPSAGRFSGRVRGFRRGRRHGVVLQTGEACQLRDLDGNEVDQRATTTIAATLAVPDDVRRRSRAHTQRGRLSS